MSPIEIRLSGIAGAAALAAAIASSTRADVDPHAGMLRFPDVSATQIVFVYANDLWVVPRDGGQASPLASPPGAERFPKFSPDGKQIAFLGNYEGNQDLYTVPVGGGPPVRVSHHPSVETLCDWSADERLIFYTNGLAGRDRIVQLFSVPPEGGLPAQLPVPYGANGAISADGVWLAYTPHTIDNRTWKRYRGGMQTDVWLFNLKDGASKKITDWEGMDTLPMWRGSTVYYLSDNGPEHRLNVWSYETTSGKRSQVTTFKDYDVKWPSMGPGERGAGEIVFQCGSEMYLLDLGTNMMRAVNVTIPGARPTIRDQAVDAKDFITAWTIAPSAKRVAVQARGDIWTLPAKHGSARNLTRTSGVAERDPAWSPDGRWVAYFCDETGEYELFVRQSDGKGEARRLTSEGNCFLFSPVWSPDSKKIVFTDKAGGIFLASAEAPTNGGGALEKPKLIDRDPWADDPIAVSWSHDSRWIAYDRRDEENHLGRIWVYNVESGEKTAVTGAMFDSAAPVFDRKGDYLFFRSSRSFAPSYGELDTSFIYQNTNVILAAPLRKDVKHPLAPKSDEEASWKDKEKKDKEDKEKADKKDEGKDKDEAKGEEKKDDEKKDEDSKEEKKETAKDDGVSGTWTGTVTGGAPIPPGGVPFTLILTLSTDNTVSGSFSTALGAGPVSDGKFDPATKDVTFKVVIADGPTVSFTLKIDGKSISGQASEPTQGINAELKGERTALATSGDGAKGDTSKPREKVDIDFDGLERRAILLPIKRGVFGRLGVNDKGHLIFARLAARGSDGEPSIRLFDITDEKKEEKTVSPGAAMFDLSADGKKMLFVKERVGSIQDASAGATAELVVTAGMTQMTSPRDEWEQLFVESWRLERDYFYDAGMHGVDWPEMKERYAKMLDDCVTREDVSFVISEMISELNVGHAYYSGGAVEIPPSVSVGMLGCDYTLENGAYRISKIHEGADWDADARGPLSQPGVDVKVGDYILAVNGAPVDVKKDPWAAFVGSVGRAVTITVSAEPVMNDKARDVVVETLASEGDLRYRAWIEKNRQHVEYRTGGKVGYLYVPSTGIDGQNDLVRMFYGQAGKPALIIDERWNSGGQIPTRFVELLNRPVTNYWARRDGKDWTWPPDAHQGPKCMLINGLSGSGGDAFPAYFKQAGLGKLIGTRTWGGLVGLSGNPRLIDGGNVTVPTFGYYERNGTWGIEGHGVDADIEVIDDPALMTDGGDPQLDAAIDHIMAELQRSPYRPPSRPQPPNRAGMGIAESDK